MNGRTRQLVTVTERRFIEAAEEVAVAYGPSRKRESPQLTIALRNLVAAGQNLRTARAAHARALAEEEA